MTNDINGNIFDKSCVFRQQVAHIGTIRNVKMQVTVTLSRERKSGEST